MDKFYHQKFGTAIGTKAGPLDAYISYGCLKYQILEHLGYKLFCGYVI